MCRSKLRSESMIASISLSSVAFYRVVVFSLYWLSGSAPGFPICMCLHLSGWNFSNHVSLLSDNLNKSDCSCYMSCWLLMILNIFVSSANKYTSESTRFGKSFMNMTKSRGPNTDHCGIPYVTLDQDDRSLLTDTCCFLSLRKLYPLKDWIFDAISC